MEDKMNFQELGDLLTEKAELTKKDAEYFLKELFDLISESLSETNPVKIKDFGTFKLKSIQSRESVDVNTGEKIEIPAHNRISFSPATALKELVNKPFSHFETTLINEGFDPEGISFEIDDDDLDEDDDDVEVVLDTDKVMKVDRENDRIHVEHLNDHETFLTAVIHKVKNNPKPILLIVLGGLMIASVSIFFAKAKRKKRKAC